MKLLLLTLFALFFYRCIYAEGESYSRLADLVQHCYGYSVIPWEGGKLEEIEAACLGAALLFNKGEYCVDRMNEVGLVMESLVCRSFLDDNHICSTPLTKSKKAKKAGYPDLFLKIDDVAFYLEIKCYAEKTSQSSFRTFYFSESKDPKITQSAHHLLLGFEFLKKDDENMKVLSYTCLDIGNLPCKKKVEYNASNKTLYNSHFGLKVVREIK